MIKDLSLTNNKNYYFSLCFTTSIYSFTN